MKAFQHIIPGSPPEAIALLNEDPTNTQLLAGGQDLLCEMKEYIAGPERLIAISRLEALKGIQVENGSARIGAAVTLTEIAEHPEIRNNYTVLAQAAKSVGSPQIRNRGTLGGNLCQRPRCWYYRDEYYSCFKKGGDTCFSIAGKNRYHAILGGAPCFMVHPSDCAPALIALGAIIHILGPNGSRTLPMNDFYLLPRDDVRREAAIEPNELITAIEIPVNTMKSTYLKFKEKESFDWALASVAVALEMEGAHCVKANIILGGVAPKPWRAEQAEALIQGKELTNALAVEAAEITMQEAVPLSDNTPKIAIAKSLMAQAIRQFLDTNTEVEDFSLY